MDTTPRVTRPYLPSAPICYSPISHPLYPSADWLTSLFVISFPRRLPNFAFGPRIKSIDALMFFSGLRILISLHSTHIHLTRHHSAIIHHSLFLLSALCITHNLYRYTVSTVRAVNNLAREITWIHFFDSSSGRRRGGSYDRPFVSAGTSAAAYGTSPFA